MKKKNFNILITCVGGELIPQSINFLKKSKKFNVKIIGVDLNLDPIGKNFCDYFYQVCKPLESKKYINQIIKISNKHKVNLIIPTSDEESLCLAQKKHLIERKNLKVSCANFSALKIFSSKILTYKKLNELGVSTPDYIEINSFKDLKKKIKKIKEFVIKPAVSRGGRDVYVVSNKIKGYRSLNNEREMHCNIKVFNSKFSKKLKNYPLILMEKLVPPTYDLDILASDDKLKKLVLRKRIVPEEPNSGHIFEKLPKNILNDFKNIVKNLKLNWLYDCDLMRDKKGNYKILEINPRPSGSVAVSCAAGVNLLEDLLLIHQNKKINIKYGIKKKVIIKPYKNFIKILK